MKSIKTQYIDLMEGRMSQFNFMRSLRMTLPQYITNVTSFKDSVRILKNKGILSEAMGIDPIEATLKSYLAKGNSYAEAIELTAAEQGMDEEVLMSQYPQDAIDTEGYEEVDEAYDDEAPSYDYNGKKLYVDNQSGEPDAPGGKVSLYDKEENEYIGIISSIDREGFISVNPKSIQPANGEDEDDEFIDMISKAEEEESGKYTKNYDFPIKEEDGSNMSDPDMAAKIVAQKYGAKLKPLFNKYQESYEQYIKDIRNNKPNQQELSKAHNVIVKAFQNQAINMAGNEMLQAGMDKTKVNNLLSGYGYFEDWLSDYVSAINKELKTSKNYDFPSGLSEKAHDGLEIEWNWDNADVDYDTDEEGNEGAFGTVFGKDKKGNAYKARFDAPVSGGDADFDSADVSSIEKTEDASELYEGKKKKEPKKELHPNQIHPQELRMGIKVELEHTDSLDKAKKIALNHLAENPFYYTALKMSGLDSPSSPKAKAPKAAKKEKAAEAELVDKINAMKPVKGFEKAKASSNKAKKETNSGVKGVSELTHNAKSVRGLQKFAATGGKMKTIKLKEDYESFLAQKRGEEAAAKKIMQATNTSGVKFSVNDMAVAPDGKKIKITGFTTGKDGKMKALYNAGMFANVYNLDDLKKKSPFRPGVDLGKSFDKFNSMLEALVREVLNEMADGRDDMNAKNKY